MSSHPQIAFLGNSEAAQAFALGFTQINPSLDIRVFDKKTDGPKAAAKPADYRNAGVSGASDIAELCHGTDTIFSLVTADQAGIAAAEVSKTILNGILFLNINSYSPETKRQSAPKAEAAGGRYVDVAVIAPGHPKLDKAPCLIAGPHAGDALEMMQTLGMEATVAGEAVGAPSVRKIGAIGDDEEPGGLTLECFLAARKAGIGGKWRNSKMNRSDIQWV